MQKKEKRTSLVLVVFGLFLLVLGSMPGKCLADSFALPLDALQGFSFQSDSQHVTPYLFSAKLTPEYRFSDFGAGLILAPRYSDPNWDAGLGLRFTWLFLSFLPDTGLRVVADGTHWVDTPNSTLEIGLVGDLSGLPRLGLWYGFDTQTNNSSIMASIGLDIVSLVKVMNPKVPQPNFGQ
jgi:hypothetical protein